IRPSAEPEVRWSEEEHKLSALATVSGGTISLDTETGTSRKEGTWELPLDNLGIFVPELGVVIGIASTRDCLEPSDPWFCQVCALDVVEARPPAVRHVWEIPPERAEDVAPSEAVSLAYLRDDSRFCVSSEDTGTSFTLVDVSRLPGGDLELAKHGNVYCHV
uniref:Uncharacterized protein n=1 Tax=Setaria italica TaxID=4555 RepID=K3Z0F7_SETIT